MRWEIDGNVFSSTSGAASCLSSELKEVRKSTIGLLKKIFQAQVTARISGGNELWQDPDSSTFPTHNILPLIKKSATVTMKVTNSSVEK